MANSNLNNAKFKNQVNIDGIFKEQMEKEELARSMWNTKWSFIKDFDKICVDIADTLGLSECKYREMINKNKRINSSNSKKINMDIKPSDPVPITSSEYSVNNSCAYRMSQSNLNPFFPNALNFQDGALKIKVRKLFFIYEVIC
ncbi:hypothetical protein FQA39_LY03984 [Lamprigera yunnana]|nr:hypothetical protein FQA39_LY03984 [Lamprigera yunnana]